VEGIFVVLASSLEIGFFRFSGTFDDLQVFFIAEGLLLVDFELVSGSDLLSLACAEGSAGVSQDVAGISDLFVSEFILRGTFSLLDVVDLVVVDLFVVDSVSELGEDIEDGIKWGFSLELGFDLNHDGHD
jgi:hypothetical protein